jgi:predicted nucleic acid-binding protein
VTFLVDTNVVSELPKTRPDPGALGWLERHPGLAVSAVTIEELTYGVERARAEARGRLREWLAAFEASGVAVLSVDASVAKAAGTLRTSREAMGRRVAQVDMLIAATALVHGRTLVTRNARDFEGCGVRVVNPFR